MGIVGGVGRVVKYIRSYHVQEVCSKVVTFEENRIICPEVAVNGQFLPGNRICFKLPEKIESFPKFAWRNRNLFVKLPEKIKFF